MSGDTSRKCPKGHVMDPNWDSCPYCEAQERSNQKTSAAEGRPTVVLDNAPNNNVTGIRTVVGEMPPSPGVAKGTPTTVLDQAKRDNVTEKRTMVGEMPPPSGDPETMVMPSDTYSGPTNHSQASDTRKIVGVLVSYSWVPGGQIFPVREGKNYIGKENSSGQNCDIQVPQDAKMSRVHALILCRAGNYEIIDQESSNGTFLNDEVLPSNLSVALENHAEFKTGSTLWTFIMIDSPAAS